MRNTYIPKREAPVTRFADGPALAVPIMFARTRLTLGGSSSGSNSCCKLAHEVPLQAAVTGGHVTRVKDGPIGS